MQLYWKKNLLASGDNISGSELVAKLHMFLGHAVRFPSRSALRCGPRAGALQLLVAA